MKSYKLTPVQKSVYEALHRNPGGLLRRHIKPSGLVCWRVLDSKFNPIINVREGTVYDLVEKGVIEQDGQNYILKATIGNDSLVKAV